MKQAPRPSLPAPLQSFLDGIRKRHPKAEAEIRAATTALQKLCRRGDGAGKGFDTDVLGRYLHAVLHSRDNPPETLGYITADSTKVTAHRLSKNDVRRIAKCAAKLVKDIPKLRMTPLVLHSALNGKIPPGDLLRLNQTLKMFDTLVKLPRLLAQFNRTHFPTVDYNLLALCRYVREKTGNWNDQLSVAILAPLKIPHTDSVDSFKMWRTRAIREAHRGPKVVTPVVT